jgi:hypothetical protein
MRGLVIVLVLSIAATATAAPWSFELPAGYTELPGAADGQLAQLRSMPNTQSVDAQIYMSPDGSVQLTRMTWATKMDDGASKKFVVSMDKGVVAGASQQATKHISDSRHWVGDQLVAESTDDKAGVRVVQRRLYSADTSDVLHILMVICAGEAGQLAECEKAQQTMQLTLPNQAALPQTAHKPVAYLIGQVVGGLLVAAVVIWLVRRRRRSD